MPFYIAAVYTELYRKGCNFVQLIHAITEKTDTEMSDSNYFMFSLHSYHSLILENLKDLQRSSYTLNKHSFVLT